MSETIDLSQRFWIFFNWKNTDKIFCLDWENKRDFEKRLFSYCEIFEFSVVLFKLPFCCPKEISQKKNFLYFLPENLSKPFCERKSFFGPWFFHSEMFLFHSRYKTLNPQNLALWPQKHVLCCLYYFLLGVVQGLVLKIEKIWTQKWRFFSSEFGIR